MANRVQMSKCKNGTRHAMKVEGGAEV